MTKTLMSCLAIAASFAAGASQAATTSFTDELLFGLAAGSLTTETFSGATLGTSLHGTVDFGPFSTTLNSTVTGSGFNVIANPGLNAVGMNGTNLQFGLLDGETLTITFDTAITAFGAIFAAVNNDNTQRSTFSGGGTTDWLPTTPGAFSSFFGIVSDTAFTSITITGLAPSEGFGIDDLRFASATPVPVPASGLLLAGVALAGGWMARRRKA
ncbi:PEP-CTERM sorting domain-containing protein [Stagnihabitans tardus]|uniref:PEP-CTERM sorting domain-containing protein n=1 Tax=Stagnihabitans tardus TaxID=2699202 RepID=A0AAE5BX08_9RHOB|nr:PEP-CTERM sorting domain-containing protein [Stagnihabitans tardus]NBZ89872.1 PEP-CTERM sorting domain-containing protein [Stagnihabitans tardus]